MPNDFNTKIIEEFRQNEGRVGGPFAGAPMVLLTTKGSKSGKPHTTPLVPLVEDGRLYVFGSMGGAPRHPAWYFNLRADPDVTVEQGTETFRARARVLSGDERDTLYARQAEKLPAFAEYQRKTSRTIPVIELQRTN
jgi:deazaflavin-dependent oxidoreductase (nitroreductase family)